MNFSAEFKRRCNRIKAGDQKYCIPKAEPRFKIMRYRSDDNGIAVMWNLTDREAIGLMAWRFKTHVKYEEGEDILVWYKILPMEIKF